MNAIFNRRHDINAAINLLRQFRLRTPFARAETACGGALFILKARRGK
jgi:hypothetical protein